MNKKDIEERIDRSRKAILGLFGIFGTTELLKILITKDINFLSICPMAIYLLVSVSFISLLFICRRKSLEVNFVEYSIVSFVYIIYTLCIFIFSSVSMHISKAFDIHFYLFIFLILSLLLGYLLGRFFTHNQDLKSIGKEVIVRENEVELRHFNPWARLSLDKAPWLRKPLKHLGYALGALIMLIGGSAAGLSLLIAEGLKRSGVIGVEIDTYAFLFFSIGMPIGIAAGVYLAPLFSYFNHWRKLILGLKNKYGNYTVIINHEKKPYSEIKQELSES
ncbi:hypothetical protein [Vibrio sp.]|uniref:hypothetical protein n=1 Tax=Vibrio sp. TaxID=678 RepID=UPI00311F2FEA